MLCIIFEKIHLRIGSTSLFEIYQICWLLYKIWASICITHYILHIITCWTLVILSRISILWMTHFWFALLPIMRLTITCCHIMLTMRCIWTCYHLLILETVVIIALLNTSFVVLSLVTRIHAGRLFPVICVAIILNIYIVIYIAAVCVAILSTVAWPSWNLLLNHHFIMLTTLSSVWISLFWVGTIWSTLCTRSRSTCNKR